MNIFTKRINNSLKNILQQKTNGNRNRVVLETLQALGFSMPKIRRMLLLANDIEPIGLAESKGISKSSVYMSVYGLRHNKTAMKVVSKSLDLKVKELFPPAP